MSVRYPAFVAEVGTEAFRPKLLAGVFTGYATVSALFAVALLARWVDVLPGGYWAFGLVGAKLATNTLAWIAWRRRWLVIELSALNIAADVAVMTGAIYFTGGVLSPLVAIYFVEVAVMALLTNVGLTITTVVGCFVCYAAMVGLVAAGVLPETAAFATSIDEVTPGLALVMVVFVAIVTLAPGVYVALIVEQLRRNEAALAKRASELVEASRAKSEFTANITHELRTPLHGIMGMGELLQEGVYGAVTQEQREKLEVIRESATGLLELIDSLLVLARAEAMRLEVSAAPVDVGDVMSAVLATGRMLVGTRSLALALDVEGALPSVRTDRQKLVSILVNVLANAIKFTPDEGSVRLEARAAKGGVEIVVRDTGRGIPADALTRIFEPYVQVDGSPVREHGGAGIGLSVVRTLAELLGIAIAVESEVGSGSTFTLWVPPDVPSDARA